MTELASTIAALITGAMIGLIVGMWIAGDLTTGWIKAGAFEFGGVAYKVERLNP